MREDPNIPNYFFSLDAVQLGQLVMYKELPETDFHVSDSLTASDPRTAKSQLKSFSETLIRRRHSFSAKIASSHIKNDGDFTLKVESASAMIYNLLNPSDVFESISESRSTKEWIEKAVKSGNKIYMIVGLSVLTDPEISYESQQTNERGGTVGIPTAVTTTIVGSVVPANFRVDGASTKRIRQDFRYIAQGEQIYSIQYRRITFKWHSPRKIEKAELGKPKWWKYFMKREKLRMWAVRHP